MEAKLRHKILLVEDDPSDVENIKRLLSDTNGTSFEIECADRLTAALERINAAHYDAIILDLSLPDSHGFETLHSIGYCAQGVPIVVLTVINDETLARKIVREGAQGYLVKGHIDTSIITRTLQYAIEHKRLEISLRDSEQQYCTTLNSMADALHVVDENLRIVLMNKGFKDWNAELGLSSDLEGKLLFEAFSFLPETVRQEYRQVFATGKILITEEKTKLHTKEVITETRKIPVFKGDRVVQVVTVIRDISERTQMADNLKESERFLTSVFMSIQDGVSVLDCDMNIIRVNATMERWYSHAMPLVGKKCYQAYHGAQCPCEVCPTASTLKTGQAAYEVIPKRAAQGKIVGWLDLYSFPLIDTATGQMKGVIEYVRDITARKQAEQEWARLNAELTKTNKKLKQLSLCDPHTGLFNHRYLEQAIEVEFHRARRYYHPLSVIMIDIDYFKSINDVYGHKFGDVVLGQFAKQLKQMLRRYDTVVRFGGEEFLIISPGTDRLAALVLADRLLDAINLYNFGNKKHTVRLKVSLGVATYPDDKIVQGMDLVNLSEQIITRAKEGGGNRVYSSLEFLKEQRAERQKNTENEGFVILKNKITKLTKKANQGLVEAILALSKTIELKDHYTGEHVEKTVQFATEIARRLNLSREEVEAVRQASMLHDLGKIGIPEKILLKRAKLTSREYAEIKKHPQIGADILRPIQLLHNIIPYIFYHHERWDGRGYLSGLKGEDIPLGARIIAIADVFQALTSDRPYRKAYTTQKAIQIIESGAGTQFDPRIVYVFLGILQKTK